MKQIGEVVGGWIWLFGYWVCLIFKKWLLSVCGSLSSVWGLYEHVHGKDAAPWWWFAGSMFLLATFLVWCDMFWEARP